MKECPFCHKEVDDSSDICECGYKFEGYKEPPATTKGYMDSSQRVEVVDFDMSFTNMVVFMVKWAIASIPAIIILTIVGLIIMAILGIGVWAY